VSNVRLACSLALAAILAGCAVGYQAHGSLAGVPGEMRGKAYPSAGHGGGRFLMTDPSGSLTCEGEAFPPASSDQPGACAGESGEGSVRCSDGRRLAIRWRAVSCRSFTGEGEDTHGNRLEFRVDRKR
jgi:hypothetical protein